MKGTYTLLLECAKRFNVKVGSLGYVDMWKGYCLYTGSGLGKGAASLEGRMVRHQLRSKRLRWHVDYLTTRPEVNLRGTVYLHSKSRLECSINTALIEQLHAESILPHAGSSDCKCDGHILRLELTIGTNAVLGRLRQVYSSFGVPIVQSY